MFVGTGSFYLSCLVLAQMAALASGQTVNREVSSVIDATTSLVRVSSEIKAHGINGVYDLAFTDEWASHLSFLSVSSGGKELALQPSTMSSNRTLFSVAVAESAATLKMNAVFTGLMEMYPAEIQQNDNQLVRLSGSLFFYSPYPTESQKLVVKMPSASVESFSKVSPYAMRGSSIHYGPYKDVAPYKTSPFMAHFTNNFPFAKFSSMVREVEVSHWGSIAVEEIYELQHAGAKLKGGFSRFEYQLRRGTSSPSFRSLTATLPAQASNVYYRDQIGNISTSELRASKKGGVDLEIQTRFPLFGGWQSQFYIGYTIPTEMALFTTEDDQYKLKLDFSSPFHNVWVEDMEFKIILPEGSTNIDVYNPYSVEEARSVRFSYLDSAANGGRPVVVLKAKNLVEEHNRKVEISYSFAKTRMVVEPLMIVASFAALFVMLSIVSRTTAIASRESFSKEN